MNIFHKKDKKLVHIDYISRNMEEVHNPISDKMFAFVAYMGCGNILFSLDEIIWALDLLKDRLRIGFTVHEDIFYYKWKIYVTQEYRYKVINSRHALFLLFHFGERKTIIKVLVD